MVLRKLVIILLISIVINNIVCPPVVPDKKKDGEADPENDPLHKLEYSRYLREVVNVLESDPNFKKMIENASVDDIKSGKIATHLDLVSHNVRTQLDELKRKEIERLSLLIQRDIKLKNIQPHEIQGLLPKHLDHQNQQFNSNDLEKLVRQATNDLEEIDRKRREEFKEHEMEKEYDRRKELQQLDEEHRKQAEEAHQKEIEERKHHDKINHPGSEDQLEEVWEKEDKLEGEEFDAKTFFNLHDTNGDGFWDEFEIESLFQIELDKIYNSTDKNFDPAEREEEMNRMREHVMNEIDKDKNKMVSLQEFIDSTTQKEFKENEEWKTIEDEPQFDNKEFENYSRQHEVEMSSTLLPNHV